jgi:hypothetical protein
VDAQGHVGSCWIGSRLLCPLAIEDGTVLRTIGDAANYVLALPPERVEHCNRWRHAARLLLDQGDVVDVSRQVHLALFFDAQLDIGAMR